MVLPSGSSFPPQEGLADAAKVTLANTPEMDMVTAVDVAAGLPVIHASLEVISTVTWSPLDSVDVTKVTAVSPRTGDALTYHW